ncbi:unnamed protein product [Orchesella dallaii]|uniref:Uncharacterized protein n=1 Tax=Orchesella dallaii TaxID=48710 RepID=A0ABP1Q9Y8_9HEXA
MWKVRGSEIQVSSKTHARCKDKERRCFSNEQLSSDNPVVVEIRENSAYYADSVSPDNAKLPRRSATMVFRKGRRFSDILGRSLLSALSGYRTSSLAPDSHTTPQITWERFEIVVSSVSLSTIHFVDYLIHFSPSFLTMALNILYGTPWKGCLTRSE